MDPNYKGIEFDIPPGFSPPEGTAEEGEFTFLGTAQIKGGKMCLKLVDGVPVQSTEGPEESTGKGMARAYKEDMVKVGMM
jgi:hypothetical protein